MKKIILPCLALIMAAGAAVASSTALPPEAAGASFMQKLRHICGVRFCGWHGHHHCHDWCDRRGRHWHCTGHE